MILLFTSEHCTWCEVVRHLLEEELAAIGEGISVYEVNIDHYDRIADVFGVMMVPTLVAGSKTISGLPSVEDLRSFLLQALAGTTPGTRLKFLLSRPSQEKPLKKEVAERDVYN